MLYSNIVQTTEKTSPLKPLLAYACLQSSAIDNTLAASYIQELKKYYQFQSSIAYLKSKLTVAGLSIDDANNGPADPPADYFYPPVDFLGGLDNIASKAASRGYNSQYEFDLALASLVYSVKDGHTFSQPCTSGTISYLRGRNTLSFVSITEDGTSAPAVYLRGKSIQTISAAPILI